MMIHIPPLPDEVFEAYCAIRNVTLEVLLSLDTYTAYVVLKMLQNANNAMLRQQNADLDGAMIMTSAVVANEWLAETRRRLIRDMQDEDSKLWALCEMPRV